MTQTETPSPLPDPTLAVVERQLAMLAELAQIGLAMSRAYGAAGLAASHAVEEILADELWQPETGRARALAGNRDAADAYQKVSRSLRLTLAMEVKTAEMLRDLQRGIITNSKAGRQDAGETPAVRLNPCASFSPPERRRPAGFCSDNDAPDFDKPERDFEHLVEFDRPDRLPQGSFREVVDTLCVDIGVAPDWKNWRVGRPQLDYEPLQPRPPGYSECRPPGWHERVAALKAADLEAHPPPGADPDTG